MNIYEVKLISVPIMSNPLFELIYVVTGSAGEASILAKIYATKRGSGYDTISEIKLVNKTEPVITKESFNG